MKLNIKSSLVSFLILIVGVVAGFNLKSSELDSECRKSRNLMVMSHVAGLEREISFYQILDEDFQNIMSTDETFKNNILNTHRNTVVSLMKLSTKALEEGYSLYTGEFKDIDNLLINTIERSNEILDNVH